MKVIVTGASGMLGSEIADLFEEKGYEVKRLMGRKDLDLTSAPETMNCVREYCPDLVIHTAGVKDVDVVETDEKAAYLINTLAVRNIALAAEAAGAKLLYTSTDSIYSGSKGGPYHEYDQPDPVNVYGRSKLMGEEEVRNHCHKYFIVRLGLLFGNKGHKENNMVYQTVKKLQTGNAIKASIDQICSASYTRDIAEAVEKLCRTDFYGEYNLSNGGSVSRYELTETICTLLGYDSELVNPTEASDIKIARRPKDTRFESLACQMFLDQPLPDWKDALRRCMEEFKGREESES